MSKYATYSDFEELKFKLSVSSVLVIFIIYFANQ